MYRFLNEAVVLPDPGDIDIAFLHSAFDGADPLEKMNNKTLKFLNDNIEEIKGIFRNQAGKNLSKVFGIGDREHSILSKFFDNGGSISPQLDSTIRDFQEFLAKNNITEINARNLIYTYKGYIDEINRIQELLGIVDGNPGQKNIRTEMLKRGLYYSKVDPAILRTSYETPEKEATLREAMEAFNKNVDTPNPPGGFSGKRVQTVPGTIDVSGASSDGTVKAKVQEIFEESKKAVSALPIFKTLNRNTDPGDEVAQQKSQATQDPTQNGGLPKRGDVHGNQNNAGSGLGAGKFIKTGLMGASVAATAGAGAYGVYKYYEENKNIKEMVTLIEQVVTKLNNDLKIKKEILGAVQNNKECSRLYELEVALCEIMNQFVETEINTRPDKVAMGMIDNKFGPIGAIVTFFNAVGRVFLERQKFFNAAARYIPNVTQYRQLLVDEEMHLRTVYSRVVDLGKNDVEGLNNLNINSAQLTNEQGAVIGNVTHSVGNVWNKLKQSIPQSSDQFLKMLSDHRVVSATAIVLTGGTLIYFAHKYWDNIKNAFSNFWTKVKTVVSPDTKK